MTIVSESVLIESKSARNNQLVSVSHDRASEILSQVEPMSSGSYIFLPRCSLVRWTK